MASDLAKGSRFVNKAYLDDVEMMDAYNTYRVCVAHQVFMLETEKKRMVRLYPTGYSFLPYPGSLMDQPHRLMEYFGCFMNGEKTAFGGS